MRAVLIVVLAGVLDTAPVLAEPPAPPSQARPADDCERVEAERRPGLFDPYRIHTTLTSTFLERSLRDYEPGTENESGQAWSDRVSTLPIPPMTERIVRPHRPHQKVFCRVYTADAARLHSAAATLIASLGYPPPETGHEDATELSTGFRDERGTTAVWMDRYRISVEGQGEGGAIARVTRQVFVSRSAGLYIQGVSDGRNERWMLERLNQLVAGN